MAERRDYRNCDVRPKPRLIAVGQRHLDAADKVGGQVVDERADVAIAVNSTMFTSPISAAPPKIVPLDTSSPPDCHSRW